MDIKKIKKNQQPLCIKMKTKNKVYYIWSTVKYIIIGIYIFQFELNFKQHEKPMKIWMQKKNTF